MACGSCKPRCSQLSLVLEIETKQKGLTGEYKVCIKGNPNKQYAQQEEDGEIRIIEIYEGANSGLRDAPAASMVAFWAAGSIALCFWFSATEDQGG